MNKVILMGNLVADPEMRASQSGNSVANFRIGVRRTFKNQEGEYESDFLSCTAFGKTAEFIEKYFSKGRRILLEGSVQTRTWDKEDGTKGYATNIVVNSAEFADSKPEAGNQPPAKAKTKATPHPSVLEDYVPVDEDDQLPF
ncbi:MAG: single-stranded DNA-binding protein [Candidatus Spyradocola sp.]|jgi:single-strand DNA-binding protein